MCVCVYVSVFQYMCGYAPIGLFAFGGNYICETGVIVIHEQMVEVIWHPQIA